MKPRSLVEIVFERQEAEWRDQQIGPRKSDVPKRVAVEGECFDCCAPLPRKNKTRLCKKCNNTRYMRKRRAEGKDKTRTKTSRRRSALAVVESTAGESPRQIISDTTSGSSAGSADSQATGA